ncbi:MAG: glycosyltransferase family 4 protein [Gemmatimonadaceae bacterium]
MGSRRGETAVDGPLTVVQICAPGAIGGLERVVQGLSIGLVQAGHTVHVIGVHDPSAPVGPFFDAMSAAGVKTVPIAMGGREYAAERRAVADALRASRATVFHAHGYRSDLLHRGPARRLGMGTVTTLHGTSQLRGLAGMYEWVHERSLRWADAVIAVSGPIERHLAVRVPRERLHRLPNAWVSVSATLPRAEARAALGLDPALDVIGWVGRLVEVKGPDLFLEALAGVPKGSWVACVIGDGPDREALEERARALGIGERVRFLGAIPDAGRYVSAFDVCCLSSRSEGTPIALLEAMAGGAAVVAFSVGGIPDVLRDGMEGWLVRPTDTTSLAASLHRALTEAPERARRAAAARTRLAQDFAMAPWILAHERIYRSAIARRP